MLRLIKILTVRGGWVRQFHDGCFYNRGRESLCEAIADSFLSMQYQWCPEIFIPKDRNVLSD
jgi:hypothetical protein